MEENKAVKTIKTQTQEETLDLNAPVGVHLHRLTSQDYRDQFVEDYNNCCLCGKELEFVHVAQFVDNVVKEDAHCSCCNIRTRSLVHTLQ